MFKGSTVMLMMLGGAVGVPYVATQVSSWADGDKTKAADSDSQGWQSASADSASRRNASAQYRTSAERIADAIRLDATPEWVYQRWDRKSTRLADLDRHGVRVPLVTGTEMSDLAGSLTYYFDSGGQLQQISFRGQTGDPRSLIALLASRYHLRAQQSQIPGEHLYQTRWNGRTQSELRIKTAPVVSFATPHANCDVQLELTHPSSGRFLDTPRQQPVPIPTQPPNASTAESGKKPQPKSDAQTYTVEGGPAHSSMHFQPRQVIKKKKSG